MVCVHLPPALPPQEDQDEEMLHGGLGRHADGILSGDAAAVQTALPDPVTVGPANFHTHGQVKKIRASKKSKFQLILKFPTQSNLKKTYDILSNVICFLSRNDSKGHREPSYECATGCSNITCQSAGCGPGGPHRVRYLTFFARGLYRV